MKNLKEPITVHTNRIILNNKELSYDNLIMKLLNFKKSSKTALSFIEVKKLPKEEGENKKNYYLKLHKEIKKRISLSLPSEYSSDNNHLKYEIIKNEKTNSCLVLFLMESKLASDYKDTIFLNKTLSMDKHSKRIIIEKIITLIVKEILISDLIQDIPASLINSDIILSPLCKEDDKKACFFINALKPKVFFHEDGEIITYLSTVSFFAESTDKLGVERVGETSNALFKAKYIPLSKKKKEESGTEVAEVRHQSFKDAKQIRTKNPREFYLTNDAFINSKLYHYDYIINNLHQKMSDLKIDCCIEDISFNHESDHFLSLLDDKIEVSKLHIVISDYEAFSKINNHEKFTSLFESKLNGKLISLEKYNEIKNDYQNQFLFLNLIIYDNSIYFKQTNSSNPDEDKVIQFNTTIQVLDQINTIRRSINGQEIEIDIDSYTKEKINVITLNCNQDENIQTQRRSSIQGLNLKKSNINPTKKKSKDNADDADINDDYSVDDNSEVIEDQDNPSSNEDYVNNWFTKNENKIKKIKTELLLKSGLYAKYPIYLKNGVNIDENTNSLSEGRYILDYIKHTAKQKDMYYHVKMLITVKNISGAICEITVDRIKINESTEKAVKVNSPYLNPVPKFYNDSFFMYSIKNKETLTAYTTQRTPRPLWNKSVSISTLMENAKEKGMKEFFNKKAKDPSKIIVPIECILGRKKGNIHYHSTTKQYHRVLLSENNLGLLCCVTRAGGMPQTIQKQTLIKQISCWDVNGKTLAYSESKLMPEYIKSHTYDLINILNSSKSTIFEKLVKMVIDN